MLEEHFDICINIQFGFVFSSFSYDMSRSMADRGNSNKCQQKRYSLNIIIKDLVESQQRITSLSRDGMDRYSESLESVAVPVRSTVLL